MAVLDPNEIMFPLFEPKQQNRFTMSIGGIPAYIVKGVSAITLTQDEIVLNHINVYRKIKGKTKWSNVTFTLFDPITPSGAQAVMEWVRLSHESITGRDGYSDFYKKDITFKAIGPVGDIVGQWVVKGAFITNASFGDYNFDTENAAQEITMTVDYDYCILDF